ncbi:MAG: hypothetical protein AAB474_00480 [Patescibacteria group bacterium]
MSSDRKARGEKVIKIFPGLWKAIYDRHVKANMSTGGHDPFHAARAGQHAFNIAEDQATARLAAIAGLCHNADRILQHELKIGKKEVPEEIIADLVNKWLDEIDLHAEERSIIIGAVLKHSLPNDPDDSQVLVALRDADRLINLEPDEIIRSGQFHKVPAVDPIYWLSDPAATFKEPRSVIKDLSHCAEWGNFNDPKFGIRLPKAQALAAKHAKFMLDYIERVKEVWEEAGLLPFTPPK